jgi:hypothetical protein
MWCEPLAALSDSLVYYTARAHHVFVRVLYVQRVEQDT